ncbi:MAG: tail fiber domain-containing protein [Bacteroidetes bacterium]|nr:tail fiber domain-containing protein [Bacteroidota bacterium]
MKNLFNLKSLLIILFLTVTEVICYGQANVNLSNLLPTSINQHLLPSGNNNGNIGSAGKSWKDVYLDGKVWVDDVVFMTNSNIATCTFLGSSAGNSNVSSNNTGVGYQSLFANTFGNDNTAIGIQSLFSNISGSYNSAAGRFALYSNTYGSFNTGMGTNALYANTTGSNNTGSGYQSLNWNTTGSQNTATGLQSLFNNTTASNNVAVGHKTLFTNTTGEYNSATGAEALYSNSIGSNNTADGYQSLYSNNSGAENTANGFKALYTNQDGFANVANGASALYSNTNGYRNVANGASALYSNIDGFANTASGFMALKNNTTAYENTAIGYQALYYNTGGSENVAIGNKTLFTNANGIYNSGTGAEALYYSTGSNNTANGFSSLHYNSSGNDNTAIGYTALDVNTTGNGNTALGSYSKASTGILNNATVIGYFAIVDASDKVRIGNTSVSSIGGEVGWTSFSDARIKDNIQENVPGLEFINELRPVTYHFDVTKQNKLAGLTDTMQWESKYDIEKIQFTGFIAQEVEAAASYIDYDFSGVDKSGEIMGLRYSEFVVPLVKAVQELDELNKTKDVIIEDLQAENEDIKMRLEKLESLILNTSTSEVISTKNVTLTDVDQSAILEQNIPNPFNGKTIIKYFVPENNSSAQIRIQNINGVEIELINVEIGAGVVNLDASKIPSGRYSYSLIIDGKLIDTKNMILTK